MPKHRRRQVTPHPAARSRVPSGVLAEVGRLRRARDARSGHPWLGSSTMLRHRLVADSLHPTDLRSKRGSLQVLNQALINSTLIPPAPEVKNRDPRRRGLACCDFPQTASLAELG